jgi:hypothetical protein
VRLFQQFGGAAPAHVDDVVTAWKDDSNVALGGDVSQTAMPSATWQLRLKRSCMQRWMQRLHAVQAGRYIQRLRQRTVLQQTFRWWRCRFQERDNATMRRIAVFQVNRRDALLKRAVMRCWREGASAARFAKGRDAAVLQALFSRWKQRAMLARHARMIASKAMQSAAFAFGRAMLTLRR